MQRDRVQLGGEVRYGAQTHHGQQKNDGHVKGAPGVLLLELGTTREPQEQQRNPQGEERPIRLLASHQVRLPLNKRELLIDCLRSVLESVLKVIGYEANDDRQA